MVACAEPPSGDGLRGPNMAICVLADAKDGYRVVFALPELDPGFSDNEILLVDRANGEPLSATQGPLRVVVPHEKRPARWIRNVQRIQVVRVQ